MRPDPTLNRKEFEELWYFRLNDAKLRLDFAKQYRHEVEIDFKAGDIPSSDGHYAYRRALLGENAALAEYKRVLRIFSDLVLQGKLPDEER